MWNAEKTYSRADEALSDGKLWRAKEILQGSIHAQGYVPELYERYGQVLLEMRDLLEAGRYLFLSGVRREEYEDPISLFVARYTRRSPRHLYDAFPRAAKLKELCDYPEAVTETLRALGLPDNLPKPEKYVEMSAPSGGWIGYIILALLGLTIVVGLVDIVRWLWSLAFG